MPEKGKGKKKRKKKRKGRFGSRKSWILPSAGSPGKKKKKKKKKAAVSASIRETARQEKREKKKGKLQGEVRVLSVDTRPLTARGRKEGGVEGSRKSDYFFLAEVDGQRKKRGEGGTAAVSFPRIFCTGKGRGGGAPEAV